MEYRLLGRTGVRVSKLCLGCWMFGNRTEEAESVRIVHAALDTGINFLDTSNRYGQDEQGRYGASETFIGRALKERGSAARDQVVLATKVFGQVGPGPNDKGTARIHIMREVQHSLRRLQMDYIDLYYLHWPEQEPPYSLLRRDAERELLPCAREMGFAVNPYSPLAGGLLSGKYRPGAPLP